MARNRQRAKERQAERRAARQAARESSGAVPEAQRRVDAPPEELGQSAYTLEHTSEDEEFIGDLEVGERWQDEEPVDGDADDGAAATAGPRGVRGGREREEADHHERGRVSAFLV